MSGRDDREDRRSGDRDDGGFSGWNDEDRRRIQGVVQAQAGGGGRGPDESALSIAGLSFTTRELLDLGAAWVALGVAFSFFFFGRDLLQGGALSLGIALAISMATVGVGFLLHELAHKVVAVRFDQIAHFRADYGMLLLAIVAGLAGFLFAAPGAVYHRGRITKKQNGLIAVAGPVTNLLLVVAFLPVVLVPGPIGAIGGLGVTINAVLAAFNMIPFGPLDGRTVIAWSKGAFAVVLVVSLAAAAGSLSLFFGLF